jgi:hypothetical protein
VAVLRVDHCAVGRCAYQPLDRLPGQSGIPAGDAQEVRDGATGVTGAAHLWNVQEHATSAGLLSGSKDVANGQRSAACQHTVPARIFRGRSIQRQNHLRMVEGRLLEPHTIICQFE